MGMRVGGSGNAWASQNQAVGNWQQKQSSVKALFTSLQTGDLATAQKAYASLSAGSTDAKANSPMAQIGKALQSGDLATAQSVAQTMLKDRTTSASNSVATASKVDVMV